MCVLVWVGLCCVIFWRCVCVCVLCSGGGVSAHKAAMRLGRQPSGVLELLVVDFWNRRVFGLYKCMWLVSNHVTTYCSGLMLLSMCQ